MPLRVLIADDEQPARNELSFQLERLDGVEVVEQAADGLQAVSLAESLAPDLVLLDVQMPGLTGFEVARRLLELNPKPEVGTQARKVIQLCDAQSGATFQPCFSA